MSLVMTDNARVLDPTDKDVDGFRLHEELGRGGMGVVYRAVRPSDGAVAAIKILPLALALDTQQAKRFSREARAAGTVRHPNLVEVQDAGQLADGTLYLRMEYLAGQTLRQRLDQSDGRVSPRLAIHVAQQLAEALAAIHQAGIVHRDLKPSNVMLLSQDGGDRVKLLDFGIARFLDEVDDLTGRGQAFGTARYMSPEQCRGARTVTATVDLYALGVLLFESLTSTHPLQPTADTREELLRAHLGEAPLSLQRLWPEAPAALGHLVGRLLHKEPTQRPSAQETASTLALLVASVPNEVLPICGRPEPQSSTDATDPPQAPSLGEFLSSSPVGPAKSPQYAPHRSGGTRRRWLRIAGGVLGFCAGGAVIGLATDLARHRPPGSGLDRMRTWFGSGSRISLSGKDFDRLPLPPSSTIPKPPPGMVYIAGGHFLQGISDGQRQVAHDDCVALEKDRCREDWFRREQPQRLVTISPFFLDRTEVTNEAFVEWLNRGVRGFDLDAEQIVRLHKIGVVTLDHPLSGIHRVGTRYEAKEGMAQLPIVLVSWLGAQTFCAENGKSLPTEAEWEFVASRGGTSRYPWGNRNPTCADAVALGRDEFTQCPKGSQPPVGTMAFDVSPEGVHDLAGSVTEWVLDHFVQTYWACGTCQNPIAPEDPIPNPLGTYRVVRGSSYFESRVPARAGFRSRAPETRFFDNYGFRCALRLQPLRKE